MKKLLRNIFTLMLILSISISVTGLETTAVTKTDNTYATINALKKSTKTNIYLAKSYTGEPYVTVNNNKPFFKKKDYTTKPFEKYSKLDKLGRCRVAYANICKELMPTEERGEIGQVKPSGWHTVKYDIVSGKYLYNRCHLIGYQLAGENANERNLITGTRYLNINGMLEYENKVAEYVEKTGNHVLYRVTPKYTGKNLVADGVLMEGYSVEDKGKGIQFCIFAYNVQPGIKINYRTGDSSLKGAKSDKPKEESKYTENTQGTIYILNTSTKKYHTEKCRNAKNISAKNKEIFNGTRNWLDEHEYKPCKVCRP